MGTTRGDLRRRIGRRLGEVLVARATVAGGNDTLRDDTKLYVEGGSLRQREAVVVGGTAANLGLIRRVSDNNRESRTVTFATPLTAATAVGDEVELYNLRGAGITVEEIHDAINDALAAAAVPAAVTVPVAAAFDSATPVIGVGGLDYISGVDYQDWQDIWHAVPAAGWRYDKATREVWIDAPWPAWLHERTVRLVGLRTEDPLEIEEEETAVNAEWLVAEAVALLRQSMFGRDGHHNPIVGQMYLDARRQADRLRPQMSRRFPPNTVAV